MMLFKTNLYCEHCVNTISPFLNKEIDIENWEIDVQGEDKILQVEGEISPEKVQMLLKDAGYQAEFIQK